MALVNITNIQVIDNPSLFSSPFQFEITFECIAELKDGECLTEWRRVSRISECLTLRNPAQNRGRQKIC
ncbi:hypothetical protein BC936DRAFT_148972 [Jimgerdemannia flammicorona]|uniref:Anti-silencing function protein 1 n=1 Tax=Jimgerdemannia flammicorona TaxID=994334 RepID=A0A433D1V1_9FUNG|nr:hypothetical protein BC936DRAFT_148972 [Jimgerdemannia flammicorona]